MFDSGVWTDYGRAPCLAQPAAAVQRDHLGRQFLVVSAHGFEQQACFVVGIAADGLGQVDIGDAEGRFQCADYSTARAVWNRVLARSPFRACLSELTD